MALISFSPAPQRDGVAVTTTLDASALVIGYTLGDPYLDQTAEIGRVDMYYRHMTTLDGTVGNRQEKKITYMTPTFSTSISWSTYAKDGTWQQNRMRVVDTDGATKALAVGTDFTSVNLILA